MEMPQFSVFTTVLAYSVTILLAPIATFFGVKYFIFHGMFDIASVSSNVWSAVAAVVVLHIALGFYIYRAYSEADRVKPGKHSEKID